MKLSARGREADAYNTVMDRFPSNVFIYAGIQMHGGCLTHVHILLPIRSLALLQLMTPTII